MTMMTLTEAIEARHSVRTFDGAGLNAGERLALTKALRDAAAPFGGKWKATIVSESEATDFRPSTYGMIRGARDYIAVGFGGDELSMLSAGFAVEKVVLEAVRLGVASCWIGATFRQSRFSESADMPVETPLKAVVALGRAKGRRSLIDEVAHFMARGGKRRPLERTFFNESVLYAVEPGCLFHEPLRLMSLAPSSVNSQPWRAIVRDSCVDFFCAGTSPLNTIDMGIGLAHFATGCDAAGLHGTFRKLKRRADGGNWRYVTSFVQSSES